MNLILKFLRSCPLVANYIVEKPLLVVRSTKVIGFRLQLIGKQGHLMRDMAVVVTCGR